MNKNVIVIIDTDIEFINRFRFKLEEDDLADRYAVEPITPNTTLSRDAMIQACQIELQSIMDRENVIGVFIDIVVVETGSALDTSGIDIAKGLRSFYPNLPLFNITAKIYIHESEADAISGASLEDIDGVLIKSYLEGDTFSARRFKNIFAKAVEKRSEKQKSLPSDSKESVPELIKEAFNFNDLSYRVRKQIDEIGVTEFWTLISKLLPDAAGTISFMQPGRSGAYVFKAKLKFSSGNIDTSPKGWVVKVVNQANMLEKELENYEAMKHTPLHRAFYPQLLNHQIIRVGSLAGLAIELEEDSMSLMDSFRGLSMENLTIIESGIKDVIRLTYGDGKKRISTLWKPFYDLSDYATTILARMDEFKGIFLAKYEDDVFKNVYQFITSDGKTHPGLLEFEQEISINMIHGDFNARNLLVKPDNQIILIDFSSRREDHVVKDIAKLERDVVFRIFDAATPNYYDWSRLDKWESFSLLNKSGKMFSNDVYDLVDSELDKSIKFILENRNTLRAFVSITEKEYLCALLFYSLLAIAHPEISLHKQVFAVKYANDILNRFE